MKTLKKNEIGALLASWGKMYHLMTPARAPNGDILFDTYRQDAFTLDYGKPPLPPKGVFFPQKEEIFSVEAGKYREVITAKKVLLFGIRSCDMSGILQATSFMTRDRTDVYYEAKKDAAVTVVMACPGPQNETCFCTTTRSGPVAVKGFDLQFYDAGDLFLIEVGSQKGEAALDEMPLAEMEEGPAREKIAAFRQESIQKFTGTDAIVKAMNRLKDRTADEKVWEHFGDKCIMCGGCTFVCPTCTCFNVYDLQTGPGKGWRERAWDACLFSGFSREASGHNPRPDQASRLRRRHEHKLYQYHETDIQGCLCGCVGCGRCSDYCPVHIGALEIARAIAE
jgi:sulfhydrogenase subunit beta (sulfur reductase)